MIAARQLMATRWDRVYMDLYISHYGFSEVNYFSEVDFSSSSLPSTSALTLNSSPLDKMKPIRQDEFQLDIKEDDSEEDDERRRASIPASVTSHYTEWINSVSRRVVASQFFLPWPWNTNWALRCVRTLFSCAGISMLNSNNHNSVTSMVTVIIRVRTSTVSLSSTLPRSGA